MKPGADSPSGQQRPTLPSAGLVAGEVALSAVVVLVCAVAIWGSRDWPAGAGLFPTIFGVLVGAVALGNIVVTVTAHVRRHPVSTGHAVAPATDEQDEAYDERAISGLSTFLWILSFPLAGVILGFVVAVPVLTFAFARLGARESWLWSLTTALMMTGLVLFVTGVMGVRVPAGIFGP